MTARAEKRRSRRIAADEAHAWARNLRLGNHHGKSVLRSLTLYVDGDGLCFVGIDHLADDCELSPDTVRRRLAWLDDIGAISRRSQWIDSSGVRNGEGRGKRTSDLIRLLMDDGNVELIEARARGEPVDENDAETTAFSPGSQQGLNSAADPVGPAPALRQPSHCGKGLISEPEPELPPSGPPDGGSASLSPDGWKEFESDWQEPIIRQSIAQAEFALLKPEERMLARQAARGYVAWRKAQKKPPNVLSAHLFLRERAAWAQFATYAPDARSAIGAGGYEPDSVEGKAITALYAVARIRPAESNNRLRYTGEITPQMLAFAQAADRASWPWIEDRQQVAAWSNFVGAHVRSARPPLIVTRGLGEAMRSGIYAPWLWPPRVDGSLTEARPPEVLMTEQDAADFQ